MALQVFAEGVTTEDMARLQSSGVVQGFTTNSSLMPRGSFAHYRALARKVLAQAGGMPVSLKVLADDQAGMRREAREICSWAPNAFAKVPAVDKTGEPTYDLIQELSAEGTRLNVTAVYTNDQVESVVDALDPEVDSYVSVYAGRLADAGMDPTPTIRCAVEYTRDRPHTKILWAGAREVFNIFQAEEMGADVVAAPSAILDKWDRQGRAPLDLVLDGVLTSEEDEQDFDYALL